MLDNGNVADKAIAIQTDNGVSVLEDQALRITHKNNPYIRLVDEADFDSMELSLQSDHAHIDLSSSDDELHFKFAGNEKITFTNTEAKFQEQVIIHTPSNVEQPFIIRGTSFTGTANSNVLFAQNVSSPASRTAIRYRGIIDHDYDLANKKYVDNQASTPEFHRLMWDPTIRDFNGYKENQPASVGQFCSMTGAVSGVVWYYISDTDLDGRIIRLPTATTTSSPASRTAVRYRGIIDHDYDLANKKYVDDQASTPEFHRLMWDPTIRDFNGYKQNQPASVGQFCSMTGAASGVVWY